MRMDKEFDLFVHEIRYLFSVETQLINTLPKIAESTEDIEFQNILKNHTKKSALHLDALKKIGALMNFNIIGETCYAVKALIDEVKEIIQNRESIAGITNTTLVMACTRLEKYEIARYKCALYIALQMGLTDVALLLHLTLSEEKEADALLTKLALEHVEVRRQEKNVSI